MSMVYPITSHTGPQDRRDGDMQKRGSNAKERLEFIHYIKLVMLGALTTNAAARALGVYRHTITRWRKVLLADGQQDTDDLRLIANDNYKHGLPYR